MASLQLLAAVLKDEVPEFIITFLLKQTQTSSQATTMQKQTGRI